jgi:tetratricopeptide (TPR) repeat protein
LEAIAVARRLGDKATLLSVLTQTYAARGQPDALPQRLADTAEELALADEIGDPVARLLARFNRVHACLEAGDIVEVDERLNDMAVIVEATSLPYLRVLLLLSRHWRLLLAGRTDDAEAAANEVLDLGNRIGLAETFGLYGAQLFRIRHEQGRLNEIVEFFAQAAADNPTLPSLRASLTDLYCQLGRYDDARQLFRHDAGNEFADFAFDLVWLTGIVRCADNAATLGDERAAASLYARLSPFSHMIAANPATLAGAVARPLGRLAALLGHSDEAEMLLRRALATHERLNAPYWTALTLLDLADLLRSRANPSDGREAADAVAHAQEIAVARGYAGLRRRVDALASPD